MPVVVPGNNKQATDPNHPGDHNQIVNAITSLDNDKISSNIVDAKGDIIAATADNTPSRLGVGSTGQVLTVDPATSTGLKWATPALANGVTITGTPSPGQVPIASSTTTASWGTVGTGGAPSGPASGDLSGSYPNPTVNRVQGVAISGTASLGKVLTATGASTAAWQTPSALSSINVFNVKNYGALGNDSNDDTAEIQAAIDAAVAAGGGTVYLPAGTYRITDRLEVYGHGIKIKGAGKGASVIKTMSIPSAPKFALYFAGTIDAEASPQTTLTANANAGNILVTVASATGLSAGERILIGDSRRESPEYTTWPDVNPDDQARFPGEFVTIQSISGNILTLKSPLGDSYTTANSASVWEFTPYEGCGIEDLSIIGGYTLGTTSNNGVYAGRMYGFTVKNVSIERQDERGIWIEHCVDTIIDGLTVQDLGANTGYGVVVGASESTFITNSTFRKCRHAVATAGTTTHKGWTHNLLVMNCHATENTSSAFESHPWATDVSFIGCTVVNSLDHGFANRSRRTVIKNCKVHNVSGVGVYLDFNSEDVTVSGCDISSTGSDGIVFGDDVGAHLPHDIVISNNNIYEVGRHGIYLNYKIDRIAIINNRFDTCGTDGWAIYGGPVAWSDVTIANNVASRVENVARFAGGSSTNLSLVGNVLTAGIGTNTVVVLPSGTNTNLKNSGNV